MLVVGQSVFLPSGLISRGVLKARGWREGNLVKCSSSRPILMRIKMCLLNHFYYFGPKFHQRKEENAPDVFQNQNKQINKPWTTKHKNLKTHKLIYSNMHITFFCYKAITKAALTLLTGHSKWVLSTEGHLSTHFSKHQSGAGYLHCSCWSVCWFHWCPSKGKCKHWFRLQSCPYF